jgi:hypothetical protein
MARRIDSLKVGEKVILRFEGRSGFTNDATNGNCTFRGMTGEGDDRRARFDTWEAFRYRGGWARDRRRGDYGSTPERIRILDAL